MPALAAAPRRAARSTAPVPSSGAPTAVTADADSLVREHLGLVHHVARRLTASLSNEADVDEMVSAGTFGLLQAAMAFDPTRGLSFSTFAVPRIRGAILDELRRQDHASRSVRRKARELGAARETLTGMLGRRPTDAEVAAQVGVTPAVIRQWEIDIEGSQRVALDRPSRSDAGRTAPLDILADASPSVDDVLTREQEIARMQAAMSELKEQERTVLALYYFEELKLQEIAEVLGLSACRISQVRTAAITKLRAILGSLRAA